MNKQDLMLMNDYISSFQGYSTSPKIYTKEEIMEMKRKEREREHFYDKEEQRERNEKRREERRKEDALDDLLYASLLLTLL